MPTSPTWKGKLAMMSFGGLGDPAGVGDVSGRGDSTGEGEADGDVTGEGEGLSSGEGDVVDCCWSGVHAATTKISPATIAAGIRPHLTLRERILLCEVYGELGESKLR